VDHGCSGKRGCGVLAKLKRETRSRIANNAHTHVIAPLGCLDTLIKNWLRQSHYHPGSSSSRGP
jgi:hypothetical protein